MITEGKQQYCLEWNFNIYPHLTDVVNKKIYLIGFHILCFDYLYDLKQLYLLVK